jgi:saccharopine dehydrogenase-like NADP-dependent oxidoreductase
MANVVVLGVGAAGEVTARLLAGDRSIDRLRIADVRDERLDQVAGKIKRDVDTMRVDLSRPAEVRRAAKDADVLVNASLPDYNLPIMHEALRLPAHYVDLASEGSPDPKEPSKVHEQLALDGDFRRRDRTAILGMGVAPGITNLLARRASDTLDRVDAIRIRVYGSGYAEVDGYAFAPLFSPETFLQEVLWPAPVWKGDGIVKLPPFSGEEEFPFPDPLGIGFCYNVNNEECETMPLFLGKPVGFIDFKYALAPHRKVLLESLYTLGLTRTDRVDVRGVKVAPLGVVLALLPDASSLAGRVQGHTCVVVEVEGRAAGKVSSLRTWTLLGHEDAFRRMGVHATAFLTGAPPAAAVQAILAGEIARRGATTAGGLAPGPLLMRAKGLGVPLFEGTIGSGRGRPLVA